MKQNLHTHSTYCDGKSTIKEMIRSALLRDFEVLGFSGHSFTDFDTSYCMSKDGLIDYLDEIDSAKKFFEEDPEAAKVYYAPEIVNAGDLRIYTGIEQDLYSERPALRKHEGLLNPGSWWGTFDYIIGSTHAFFIERGELEERTGSPDGLKAPEGGGVIFTDNGIYVYVDYSEEALKWATDNIYKGDAMALAEAYFKDEARIVSKTDCDITGHFDLLLKFNEKVRMFDESDSRYLRARDKALETVFDDFRSKGRRPLFEVNTGAMARGYRTTPYPSEETVRVIRDMGGSFIINSDCHRADLLDHGFREARELLKKTGYRSELIEVPGGRLEIFD